MVPTLLFPAAFFLIFGSTDTGEPIESAVALLLVLWLGQRKPLVPWRSALVRPRDA